MINLFLKLKKQQNSMAKYIVHRVVIRMPDEKKNRILIDGKEVDDLEKYRKELKEIYQCKKVIFTYETIGEC